MDSDDNGMWGSSHSIEVASQGQGLPHVASITTHTSENTVPGDSDDQPPALLSDSDSDDETTWNNLGNYSSGSSDTSDGDYLFNGNLSDASDDSSIADDDDDYGVFEMLSNHFDVFNNFVPAFFGVSLQMLYARIMENITLDDERESPTPQHILDLLPATKVAASQVASNLSCCICFCDYILNEDLLKLPCSHIYHKACILDWLKIKCTCPTCRLDLTTNITDENETDEMSDFSTENSAYNIDHEHIYDNIDTYTTQQISSDNHSASSVATTEFPVVPSRILTVNNNSNSYNNMTTSMRTGNALRTSRHSQSIQNTSNGVFAFSSTNTEMQGPSNSSTVELMNTDKSDDAVQPSISNNAKGTKKFSRETEIW